MPSPMGAASVMAASDSCAVSSALERVPCGVVRDSAVPPPS